MDDLERLQYIFDIQGYLIIPDVLTSVIQILPVVRGIGQHTSNNA